MPFSWKVVDCYASELAMTLQGLHPMWEVFAILPCVLPDITTYKIVLRQPITK